MLDKKDMDALIVRAKKRFEVSQEAEEDNRRVALEDIKFGRKGIQWHDKDKRKREEEGRPVLTINKMPAFIRQVVNDARQNKPQIKIHPVDSAADPETAKVINGLIRNIERTSKSDIAYDTAVENAVSGGFGYMRVGLEYAYDDVFDLDITIDRVANPFSIFGDPDSDSADGSDWNTAFVVERLPKEDFKSKYGDKAQIDFDDIVWGNEDSDDWKNEEGVLVAEFWERVDVPEKIHQVTNGEETFIFSDSQIEEDQEVAALIELGQLKVLRSREVTRKKVTQYIMTGQEVLEVNDWPGRYIPIVPVYGDEFFVEGVRHLRSLIHNAVDAQRMHNYWRTTSTELVALAPRTPYIGEEGAFDADPNGWATANTVSHPYLEYSKGKNPPQRQPLDSGPAAGAIQEALMAADDMKAIVGIYDASLGAKSNETSGRAILARQREGDVSTFHFIDNLSRSIRQLGNIILDLLPHVYDSERVVRVLGEDDVEEEKRINTPFEEVDEEGNPKRDDQGNAIIAMHNLTVGKYDLTVSAGPSFTTRREEAAYQMTEALRNYPNAAPVILPIIAKNSDWPDADEIAERLKEMMGQQDENAIPPQIQMAMAAMQQQMQALAKENEELKADRSIQLAETEIKAYDAETKRMKAAADTDLSEMKLNQSIQPAPTVEGVQQ